MNNDIAVGISFGDNDFYNTMVPFMENLQKAIKQSGFVETKTKEELRNWIIRIFNDTAVSFYWMFQNRYQYSHQSKDIPDFAEHMKAYFKVDKECVYIGEEVNNKCAESDWLNGEFFFFYSLDSEIEVM
jgi:hypothetical protein